MYMAANAPVTLSLHFAGITILDETTLGKLLGGFLSSGYGSMMGPNRDAGLPFEVTALLLSRLVPVNTCVGDTDHEGEFLDLLSALAPHSLDCGVGEVFRTTQAVTVCLVFQAWGVAESAPTAAAAAAKGLQPRSEMASPRPPPWKPTPRQTALLLRHATHQPTIYFCQRFEPWSSVVDGGMVRTLQHELITSVDAAMAAASAAGKPVGVVQLMSWLEPLLYRCVQVFSHIKR